MYLDEPKLGLVNLDKSIFNVGLKHPFVEAYINLTKDIAILLGADKDRAENDMVEVFEFEAKYVKWTLTR